MDVYILMNYSVLILAPCDYLRDKEGFVRRFYTYDAARDEMSRNKLIAEGEFRPQTAYVCPAPLPEYV